MFPVNVTVRLGVKGLQKSPTQGNWRGLICCLGLMSLCTTPGTPVGYRTPPMKQAVSAVTASTAQHSCVQTGAKWQRNSQKRSIAGTYRSGRFLWHWGHLQDLNDVQVTLLPQPHIAIIVCQVLQNQQLEEKLWNSTLHLPQEERSEYSWFTHHNFTDSQNSWGWEGSLLKAGPAATACSGPHSVTFLLSPRLETLQLLWETVPEFNHLDGIGVTHTIIRQHMLGKWLIEKQELKESSCKGSHRTCRTRQLWEGCTHWGGDIKMEYHGLCLVFSLQKRQERF